MLRPHSLRGPVGLLAALAALLLPATGAMASGDAIQPLVLPASTPGPFAARFHDRVRAGRPLGLQARAAPLRRYTTKSGLRIEVEVSARYADTAANRSAAQAYVDFLDSRVHGAELAKLRVYIGKPDEIRRKCGSQEAVACYYTPPERRMYVPGEEDGGGIPVTYALTHEYGHHIASYRRNALGPAFLLGAQRWASQVHVCAGVLSTPQRFYPGAEDKRHYYDNPGEGFADAYAHLPGHFPDAPFQYNRLFRPDAAAAGALRADVRRPWRGLVGHPASGTLGSRVRSATYALPLRLDGPLRARLSVPAGARFDVQLLEGTTVLRSTRGRARRKTLTIRSLCRPRGQDRFDTKLRVVRRSGLGRFGLTASAAE